MLLQTMVRYAAELAALNRRLDDDGDLCRTDGSVALDRRRGLARASKIRRRLRESGLVDVRLRPGCRRPEDWEDLCLRLRRRAAEAILTLSDDALSGVRVNPVGLRVP